MDFAYTFNLWNRCYICFVLIFNLRLFKPTLGVAGFEPATFLLMLTTILSYFISWAVVFNSKFEYITLISWGQMVFIPKQNLYFLNSVFLILYIK